MIYIYGCFTLLFNATVSRAYITSWMFMRHTHTHTSNFLENSICPIFDSLAWRLQTPFDDSAMRQVKTLLTLRMFAQTGSLLGQVLLNGKVSYGSITVLGDWEVTDGFVASAFNEVLWISWVCWGCLNWRVDGRWGMDCGWLTRARVGGGEVFFAFLWWKRKRVCVLVISTAPLVFPVNIRRQTISPRDWKVVNLDVVEMHFAPFIYRMLKERNPALLHARVPYAVAVCEKAGTSVSGRVLWACVCAVSPSRVCFLWMKTRHHNLHFHSSL